MTDLSKRLEEIEERLLNCNYRGERDLYVELDRFMAALRVAIGELHEGLDCEELADAEDAILAALEGSG